MARQGLSTSRSAYLPISIQRQDCRWQSATHSLRHKDPHLDLHTHMNACIGTNSDPPLCITLQGRPPPINPNLRFTHRSSRGYHEFMTWNTKPKGLFGLGCVCVCLSVYMYTNKTNIFTCTCVCIYRCTETPKVCYRKLPT